MESNILDFSKSSYIKVNHAFLGMVKANFPGGQISDTLSAVLNVILHSAIISNYSGKGVENKYKRVTLTERTIDVALSTEAVRELFSINQTKSTTDAIVKKKRRPTKKEMDSYWQKMKSLIAIQVISDTDTSETVSNLFIEIIKTKGDNSINYPYELVLNRRLIDYVAPRSGEFESGYTRIGSLPAFLMPKRAVYMYYFLSMYSNLIVTRKWNKGRPYTGHELSAVTKALGVENYSRSTKIVENLRLLCNHVNRATGSAVDIETVKVDRVIKKLDFKLKEVTHE